MIIDHGTCIIYRDSYRPQWQCAGADEREGCDLLQLVLVFNGVCAIFDKINLGPCH